MKRNEKINDNSEYSLESNASIQTVFAGKVSVKIRIILILIVMIVFGVANSVLRKKMQNAFGTRYVFFREELTNLMYNLYATAIVLFKLRFTNDITPEMRKFPIWKFAILGFFDGFADFLTSVGGVNTPGSWQVILSQLVIFFTMVAGVIVLQLSFHPLQLVGVLAILGGITLSLLPDFLSHKPIYHLQWYSVAIFTGSNIPAAISATFKQKYFHSDKIDVFWLTTLVSWTQLVLTWVFLPLLAISVFGGIELSTLPEIMIDGAKCFIGDTSVPVYDDQTKIGYCNIYAPIWTIAYSITGFLQGIAALFVIAQGSAVLSVIATAIQLPLANLAFNLPLIMGPDVEPFSWWNVGGLGAVVLGFFLYSFFGKEFRKKVDVKIDDYTNDDFLYQKK